MTTAERGPQDSETANVIRRTTAARLGGLALAAAQKPANVDGCEGSGTSGGEMKPTKSIWIWSLVITVTGAAYAQDRPNVVLILADDVGYGDIGAYGAGEVRGMPTPRIDQLAREG